MLAVPWLQLLVSALLWCQRSAFFLCQSTSVSSFILVPALFWGHGASSFLVPALLRYQHCISIGPLLLSLAKFWCQQIPGVNKALVSAKVSAKLSGHTCSPMLALRDGSPRSH